MMALSAVKKNGKKKMGWYRCRVRVVVQRNNIMHKMMDAR